MKKHLRFALVTAWILLSRGYDAYCTAQFTPDLTREANPLVSLLGFGWLPLLLTIGLLLAYSIYAFYLRTYRPMNMIPSEPGLTPKDLIAYLYLGYRAHWSAMVYRLPASWQRFHQYMGQIMPACLVYAGIVSTLMWWGIKYTEFYPPLHNVAAIYTLLVLGCLLIIRRWHGQQYRLYQLQMEKISRS